MAVSRSPKGLAALTRFAHSRALLLSGLPANALAAVDV
jgi:hypothetical protein